ncbi:MAG: glycogen/starch synthase [Duncaniella sp.]|nr:glycogen/starch synthase [Duncaniella sp.]
MEAKKILFISQEVAPYLPDSPMSVLGRDIPQEIHGKKLEVRIFTPKYNSINERRNQLHEVIRLSGINIVIDDTDHPLIIKVATLLPSRMQVYFIDNDDYFHPTPEKGLETEECQEDNDERIIFFTTGVIETVKKLRWPPAVVQCTGWISLLTPLYLRSKYEDDPAFKSSKIVLSLHPDKFEGTLDARMVEKLRMDGITDEQLGILAEAPIDTVALYKSAIDYADVIMEVAEGVDPEILDYAKASGKPFLPYVADDQRKARNRDFYASLVSGSMGEDAD